MKGSGRARLAAATVAFLLPLVVSQPAGAVPPPFTPATCATGEITRYSVERDEQGRPVLELAGWVQPCDAAGVPYGFSLIRYKLGGTELSHRTAYGAGAGPTAFDLRVGVSPYPIAVCVVDGREGRVACLRMDFEAHRPVPVPIPADDPVLFGPPVVVTNPTCGTCV